MYKLHWYVVHGKVHKWISEFLTTCLKKVVLNGSYLFYFCEVSSGVLQQGTVLGPSLFLIYINDFPECVNHSKIRLFANNCIVYRCIHNQQDVKLLQEDINAIQTWYGHQHNKWILLYPNGTPYTLPKLQRIRWRTLITFMIYRCYP